MISMIIGRALNVIKIITWATIIWNVIFIAQITIVSNAKSKVYMNVQNVLMDTTLTLWMVQEHVN